MSKNVLVVGTGTIGEPLIGLLSDFKTELGLDEVFFYKRTPLRDEIAKVNSLISRGAKLVASNETSRDSFEEMGRSSVCTGCKLQYSQYGVFDRHIF